MDVKTRFNIGDAIFAITKNKVKEFSVDAIILKKEGVYYRDRDWEAYEEDACFGSRQELCDYILGNTKDTKPTEAN
ncbi:MAG: hypothetical protein NC102_10425 [Clostridium sp.]|nr:hypothetical protein [Clostridium sp.]